MRCKWGTCAHLAVGAWLAVSAVHPTSSYAQAAVAHVEGCISWDYRGDRFGAINNCKVRAAIMFMLLKNQRVVDGEIGPGEFLDVGMGRQDSDDDEWMFTACPGGHVPNVPFSLQYKDAIYPSLYNCVRKQLI